MLDPLPTGEPREPVVIDGQGPFDFGKPWEVELLHEVSAAERLAVLVRVVAAAVVVVGVFVPASIALRAVPGRVSEPLMRRLDRALASLLAPSSSSQSATSWVRVALRVCAIAICAALLSLSLPAADTLDYKVGMAAFLIALAVVATM